MKRIVSIFLIAIFLFNVIGYYGIYVGMRYHADTRANHAIENGHYDQSKIITLKVPLMLPYVADRNFEHVKGDFEYEGEFYKLVGQHYENDTLFIVSLRIDEHKKAVEVFTDLVKKTQSVKTLTGLLKDYNPVSPIMLVTIIPSDVEVVFQSITSALLSTDRAVLTPPPDLFA